MICKYVVHNDGTVSYWVFQADQILFSGSISSYQWGKNKTISLVEQVKLQASMSNIDISEIEYRNGDDLEKPKRKVFQIKQKKYDKILSERNLEIVRKHEKGETFRQLEKDFNLSYQRIQQIYNKVKKTQNEINERG
jgi:hypothetical protein